MHVHAAVVRSFGDPPRYEPFDLPAPSGSDPARLASLPGIGADATVALTGDADATAALAEAASEVDLVIDYLWGKPASAAIMALLRARADRSRALNWIQIGSVAGPTIDLPSVALRSANLGP